MRPYYHITTPSLKVHLHVTRRTVSVGQDVEFFYHAEVVDGCKPLAGRVFMGPSRQSISEQIRGEAARHGFPLARLNVEDV